MGERCESNARELVSQTSVTYHQSPRPRLTISRGLSLCQELCPDMFRIERTGWDEEQHLGPAGMMVGANP